MVDVVRKVLIVLGQDSDQGQMAQLGSLGVAGSVQVAWAAAKLGKLAKKKGSDMPNVQCGISRICADVGIKAFEVEEKLQILNLNFKNGKTVKFL